MRWAVYILIASLMTGIASTASHASQEWHCVTSISEGNRGSSAHAEYFAQDQPINGPFFQVWDKDFYAGWLGLASLDSPFRFPDDFVFGIQVAAAKAVGFAEFSNPGSASVRLRLRKGDRKADVAGQRLHFKVSDSAKVALLLSRPDWQVLIMDRNGRRVSERAFRMPWTAEEMARQFDRHMAALREKAQDVQTLCTEIDPGAEI